jgi:GNAT superfamily N-acetyltransferase
MATDLLIRPATPADTEPILDLVKRSLGEATIPRSKEYWKWKHQANPFGPSPCLVAEADGQIVGLRAFMRWAWQVRGATVPAVRAVDTATDAAWRGKGIFTRLTLALLEQMRDEGVAFVFNTPNRRSMPGYLKMGWSSLGRLSLWARPVRLGRLARVLSPARRQGGDDGDPGGDCGSPVSELLEDPALPRFLDALSPEEQRFSTPRSREYAHWRYTAIPGFDYRAAWDLDGDNGAAVVVRLRDRERVRELRLCQLLVGGTLKSRRMGRDLLRSLLRETGADVATAMGSSGTPVQRVLLRSGFLPVPRSGPVMTVRPLSASTNGLDPLRRSAWDLSIGDLELF